MKRDTIIERTTLGSLLEPEIWGAEFSACMRYRYQLFRIWDSTKPALVVCLLNPSTATHEINDPTVTRCMVRAVRLGYGGLIVLNAFAWRDTDPEDMKRAADPVGAFNDGVIEEICRSAPLVIVGWGKDGAHRGRDAEVLALLRRCGVTPWALGLNGDGTPKHPLYVPYDAELVEVPA